MQNFYLYLLFATVAGFLSAVFLKPARIYEYPFFMAAVMAAFILPQAYSLCRFPGGVRTAEIEDILLICSLCLWCCAAGYYFFKPSKFIVGTFSQPVNESRLFHVGWLFTIIGLASLLLIPKSRVEFASRGGLTGIATIYIFFSALAVCGFAIFLQLIRSHLSVLNLVGLLASALSPVLAVFAGRREPAAIFVLIILLTGYFKTRKPPKRIAVFAGLVFAMLAIPATGIYRTLWQEGELRRIDELDLVANFKDFIDKESILELRNGAAVVESTRVRNQYAWGAGHWNQMVIRFVPAQIVGTSTKNALLIGTTMDKIYASELATNYEVPPGSTLTGMGDSYEQFGWLGCLFFALVGIMFRSIWVTALQPQAVFAQLFYILICTSAMRAITHQTVDFFPGVTYHAVFMGAAYLYARVPPTIAPMRRTIVKRPKVQS
jgi:hypothetical protein